MFVYNFSLKEIKASDLLKDSEIMNKIRHQLTPPEKDKGKFAVYTK